jgi:integrase
VSNGQSGHDEAHEFDHAPAGSSSPIQQERFFDDASVAEADLSQNAVPAHTNTIQVFTRHSKKCQKRSQGRYCHNCSCPKWLYIYEDGRKREVSAKTRVWDRAEERARELRDAADPEKQELRRLREEKERKAVLLEEAVALYHADMIARIGENGTVSMSRSLLGRVDPKTKTIVRSGHFFRWVESYNALQSGDRKLRYVADIGAPQLTEWRSTWKFNDLTKAQRWIMVKQFFNFCERQNWIQDSPARKLQRCEVSKGNRTAVFTEQQYENILQAIGSYDPENVPEATRKAWQRRLLVFTELLRWSGMALVDAVAWKPTLVDTNGVLRYRRHKSGELAIVPLPEHVIELLRDVPLERDSVGDEQPFRTRDVNLLSDTAKWHRRLKELFSLARITEVETENGRKRKPHPHMFRDTFAVWYLRHGAKLHTVSKALGHSSTETTERSYLPWVQELQEAHVDDMRKTQSAVDDIVTKRQRRNRNLVSIAQGRRGR